MITRLDHTDPGTATAIRAIWQVSYPVEAELLGVTDFPPLQRTLAEFTASENTFYGYYEDNWLAAVIEIDDRGPATHLQSLVVDPAFFRRGIASRLIEFVLANYTTKRYTVETGAANEPAIQLYRKFGFAERYTYLTEHGIRKVRMER